MNFVFKVMIKIKDLGLNFSLVAWFSGWVILTSI